MLEWKSEYETGISLIDIQHMELVNIANRIYKLIKNDYAVDKYDKIVTIIEELKEYTISHFVAEEEYMLSIKYKKFFSHKVEHDEFIKKLDDINLSHLDVEQDKYLLELLDFVVKWLIMHIIEKDKYIGV
ncbi:Bacteriohemerythrin [compost metagenome]